MKQLRLQEEKMDRFGFCYLCGTYECIRCDEDI